MVLKNSLANDFMISAIFGLFVSSTLLLDLPQLLFNSAEAVSRADRVTRPANFRKNRYVIAMLMWDYESSSALASALPFANSVSAAGKDDRMQRLYPRAVQPGNPAVGAIVVNA